MKKFIIQIIVLLVITFGALAYATAKFPQLPFIPQNQKVTEVKIGETLFNVEIADNTEKRKKGLGGRESLATGSGMLFVYQTPDKYIFWMKSVSFPLDFIWIRSSQVVDIIKNVPGAKPGQSDDELPRYAPNQPVDMILEVNGGFVEAHGIKVGDKVEIKH